MPSDHTRRAIAAYFRAGGIDQPSNASGIRVANGLRYVHLFNARGTLAVYRILNSGKLRRLRRWPPTLNVVQIVNVQPRAAA
ncbi:hypothetical protein EDC22_102361 [Tepidamorphus gemmatus]|uniref:Uncharacterized protein n=1 Tax=Tepidamorphus gemmatus TaxID=747076 RepID=A0A4R3MGK7_9HYPH|nr:hypothetical protein [Tepidamorphus gemmatus]TCT12676.1 hypothetical protein EDC22_102361 [Tepidamorphus gemmatus]